MKKLWPIRVLIIIWIAFIFFNSLQTAAISGEASGVIAGFVHKILIKLSLEIELVRLSYIIRKLAHVTEFFILSLLLVLCEMRKYNPVRKSFTNIILLSLFIAIVDELIQSFVPGRSGELRDVGIDMIGSSLASFLIFLKHINRPKFEL